MSHTRDSGTDWRRSRSSRAEKARGSWPTSGDAPQRARRDLLDLVGHDLANAITAARLSASMLRRKGGLSSEAERYTRLIDEALQQMIRLLGDLHDAQELATGTFTVRPTETVAPEELLARASDAAHVCTSAHTVEMVCAPNLPLVQVDRQRIAQVFLNLIGNAIKFTPTGGHVAVGAEGCPETNHVTFFVRDSGNGIAPSDQPFVFLRRWRADSQHTQEGLGLGLSICRDIVEGHGGHIYVTSRAGEGTTICFALPTLGVPHTGTRPPHPAATSC